jgi:serine/threonine protein kinase
VGSLGDEPAADAGLPAGIAGSLVAGARVGGYRLERQLGRGGMAMVYLARDERLDRLVALKIMAPERAADEEFRKRFIRESQIAAAVDHPHIIPVFDAGDAGGLLYIAMRYVPGGDVGTVIRREGSLSAGRAVAVIAQVAAALDAAHAAGLVHRDVKPANMLVDARAGRSEHVYLADFGVSKKTLAASTGLTGTGQFLGTWDYVAPEQIQGRPADRWSDQYGLACAAFELLTGAPPFQREEASAVLYAHLSAPPPPVGARREDLPPAVDQVLARALAKAPADRYSSCQDFADALLDALGTGPHGASPQVAEASAPDYPPTEIVSVSEAPSPPGSDISSTPTHTSAAGLKARDEVDHRARQEADRRAREEADLADREARARSTGRQGDPAGARDQLAALLPVRERVSGAEDPETLTVRAGLALWTGRAGDPAAARDQLAALLPARERVSGAEHPHALTVRHNLAFWTGQAGDPAGARDQFAALLPARERVSGAEDPETLNARYNLAFWTGQAGDPAAARDQFAALLPVRERALGASHPDTLATRRELTRWTSKAAGRAGIG